MAREITMRDLARELGLSISTIGRSLANEPGISEATKARVRQAADALGYVRNTGARMMRTRQSSIIGLIIPNLNNDFYGAAVKAMSKCCEDAGYQLMLGLTGDKPESELRHVRGMMEARAAGIVIAMSATPLRETQALLERVLVVDFMRESGVPGRAWFGIDGWLALSQATAHLIALNHRRIAFVGSYGELSTGRARLKGFRAAFMEAGIACPEDLIRTGPPDAEFGRSAMADLLAGHPPTAVVSAGPELTVGILDAVGQSGLAVPGALSVIGFGDTPWFRWWSGGLTAMALPTYDIAYAAGGYLLRRIEAQQAGRIDSDGAQFRALHSLSLIIRASTAAAPQGKAA